MARVGRLGGALLAETNGAYYLVGATKRPCDWAALGFLAPTREPGGVLRLEPLRDAMVVVEGPFLNFDVEGTGLPEMLVQRFVIERNGSVSERLLRLVLSRGDADAEELPDETDARWLGHVPDSVWSIVKDSVLRCV